MPTNRNRNIRRDEAVSLRKNGGSPLFTDAQILTIAVFASSVIQAGHGVYLKMNAEGNSVRLKVYTDDDSYQDTLNNQDNLPLVLSDYAKQLKSLPFYEQLLPLLWHGTENADGGAA